jgi:hypothetical protein
MKNKITDVFEKIRKLTDVVDKNKKKTEIFKSMEKSTDVHRAVLVGTKGCSLVGQSASRTARRLKRQLSFDDSKKATQLRKFQELHHSLAGSHARKSGETLLIHELSLSKSKNLAQTISTHGNGIQVERAPQLGYSLKAIKDFPAGAFITQYEGMLFICFFCCCLFYLSL